MVSITRKVEGEVPSGAFGRRERKLVNGSQSSEVIRRRCHALWQEAKALGGRKREVWRKPVAGIAQEPVHTEG